jgi:hypothetical protein
MMNIIVLVFLDQTSCSLHETLNLELLFKFIEQSPFRQINEQLTKNIFT